MWKIFATKRFSLPLYPLLFLCSPYGKLRELDWCLFLVWWRRRVELARARSSMLWYFSHCYVFVCCAYCICVSVWCIRMLGSLPVGSYRIVKLNRRNANIHCLFPVRRVSFSLAPLIFSRCISNSPLIKFHVVFLSPLPLQKSLFPLVIPFLVIPLK